MIRVGLTGGIGAGKSTVAKTFADCGAFVIDSDAIAREVVAPGSVGLDQLVAQFGSDIVDGEGALDRQALATKAFVDAANTAALNGIVHPLVGARTWELLQQAPADAVVVQDIPLLVENSMAPLFHTVVVVDAPEGVRLQRLTGLRGLDETDAKARIRAQATTDQRRAVADVWLDNSGSADELAAKAVEVWKMRLIPFEANVRARRCVSRELMLSLPDPAWPVQAERIMSRLRMTVGDKAMRIDHIGSTSVPELIAKPIIDIQISVADLSVADDLADTLADAGFPVIPQVTTDRPKPSSVTGNVDITQWHKRFHGSADPGIAAHIHLRRAGSPGQQFALNFRDWLRTDRHAREEYTGIKRAALAQAHGDASRYVEAKEPWLDDVARRLADRGR